MKKTGLLVLGVFMLSAFAGVSARDKETIDFGAPSKISRLEIKDLKVGTGKLATQGKLVTVHYVGKLLNGQVFDSSRERKMPFTFRLGAGEVIRGWDKGVEGMKTGGLRHLLIPSHLAYGSQGAGKMIPPNTPLQFEVELLDVQ